MPVSLAVGLGNPGREYAETRHNAGYRAISAWAEKLGAAFAADSARKGEFARAVFGGAVIWLAKPTTYMNDSGECVSAFARYRKIDFSEVAVVYDDITLPPGTLKFSVGGGDGGPPEEQALFAARTPDYIYGLELLASRGLVAAQNTLNKHTKP